MIYHPVLNIWTPPTRRKGRVILPDERPSFPGADELEQPLAMPSGIVSQRLPLKPMSGGISSLQDAIGYWKLGEATGATRLDSTSHASNLTDHASVAQVTGKIANAASFASASSQYLSCVTNATLAFTASALSFCCWFQLVDTSSTHIFFGKGASFSPRGYQYYMGYRSGGIQFGWYRNSGYDNFSTYTVSPTLNAWHFVWLRGATGGPGYQFGYDSDHTASPGQTGGFVGGPDGSGGNDFNIGAYAAGSFHNGLLEGVGIWNRRITDAEVDALWNGGAGKYVF